MGKGSGRITLRPARFSDADALWPIMCDPDVVHYSFESGRVSRSVFEDWLSAYLDREDALLFMAEAGSCGIGYVRFDREAGSIEVDIAVAKEQRRKGYGRALLRQGMEHMSRKWPDVHSVLAVVHLLNEPSRILFESEGFVLQSMGTRQGISVNRLTKTLAEA